MSATTSGRRFGPGAVVFVIERDDDQQHGPKDLFSCDAHAVRHVGKDRGFDEPAGFEPVRLAEAACEQDRALVDPSPDHRLDPVELNTVEERTDMIAFLSEITGRDVLDRPLGNVQSLVIAAALDQKAGWRITGLPCVEHTPLSKRNISAPH